MIEHNYSMYRGDVFEEQLVFANTDGEAVDITDWTIFFTLKKKKKDSDDKAIISKTITDIPDPTSGTYLFTLLASETNTLEGIYFYDFQVKMVDGKIYTIISGTMDFEVDITRRTS